jgi:glycosyltransferase involved in cell wall biosynthesis
MWEQILYLSRRHLVTVVAFGFSDADSNIPTELQASCADVIIVRRQKPLGTAPPSVPRLIHEYGTSTMRELLSQLGGRMFDLVLIEHIFMAQYADLFGEKRVLQEHNIESRVLKRFALLCDTAQGMYARETHASKAFSDAKEQWRLLENYENAVWPTFPLRITVSELDKHELESRCGVGRTIVVENGVNLSKMKWLPEVHKPAVLFMGTLDYYPNIDAVFYFVQTILPNIWSQEPSIQFHIAGRNPPEAIMDLAKDSRIKVIPNPSDMVAVASECRISVVPLRFGSGSRLKILDSMAMGLPVVSTRLGCEGLLLKNWEHLIVCETANEFVESVLLLCRKSDLYQQLRSQGRQVVEVRYEWRYLFERLERELQTIAMV